MPLSLMRERRAPLRLVIFDCDGVLVDSELVCNTVVAAELTALGWEMDAQAAERAFLGLTFTDMQPIIERRLGRMLEEDWKQALVEKVIAAMAEGVEPIPGAVEALHATTSLGLPWRVASNSSHEEMHVKFGRLGIRDLVAGRVHSHRDVGRGKPAPDLFLAAAAAQGVAPEECVVIEDSIPGATAARAAGMDCLGYAAHHDGMALREVGAVPFRSMFDLPSFLAAAPR
jgi:HAD superfamily hydrolase (TIGR01509 family)